MRNTLGSAEVLKGDVYSPGMGVTLEKAATSSAMWSINVGQTGAGQVSWQSKSLAIREASKWLQRKQLEDLIYVGPVDQLLSKQKISEEFWSLSLSRSEVYNWDKNHSHLRRLASWSQCRPSLRTGVLATFKRRNEPRNLLQSCKSKGREVNQSIKCVLDKHEKVISDS